MNQGGVLHGTAAFDLAGDILLYLVDLVGGAGGTGAGVVSVGRRGEERPLAAHGGELFVGDRAGRGHQRRAFRGGPGGGDAGVSHHEAPGAGCRDTGRGGKRPLHLHAL